ncbi:MAG: GNAT family N-acetyltransferase [Caldilineaceae bacterium]
MQELTIWDEHALLHLFSGLEEHLAVEAVVRGAASGRVWVDEPSAPRSAVIWVQHRVFVAAEDTASAGAARLNTVVAEVAASARARGDWGVGVYGASAVQWESVLDGLVWKSSEREYWETTCEEWKPLASEVLVDKLALRAVDRELVEQAQLGRMEQLREEMCSERPSVEDFLARSFGVCLVDEKQDTLAGWCLSEYNCGDRCEVGIEVVETYQRRGLGTLLARALCREAFTLRGMRQVGWHCLAANVASGATARRAGLRLAKRYVGAVVLLRG